MPIETTLPGLDRLITVCQRHALTLKLSPPLTPAPTPGESIFGEPLDAQLAAVYQRVGAAEFGPFALHGPTSDEDGLILRNEWLREHDEVQFRSSLVFGWRPDAYYFGTVPKLADPQGLQPVVYIDGHEVLFAIPIASSVDRFLLLYSRYLEQLVVDPDYVESGVPDIQFPWGVAQLVAQDAPLIEQVRAGRFDFLTDGYRGALQWLQKLRGSPP